jgi:hypothetical protein
VAKVKVNNNTKIPLSARERLQISQLQLDQRELMGTDVDLESLKFQLRGTMPVEMIDHVTEATTHRTIAGASTLTVNVLDEHRVLLRSGMLSKKVDIQIEGLWFRLVNPQKSGDMLNLVFEDREIAVLRTYAQPIKASAATNRINITRAQFVLRMIKEPVEFNIPYWIPELKVQQPIGTPTQASPYADALTSFNNTHRTLGINPNQIQVLRVEGQLITTSQLKVATTILDVGAARLLARPILVMAIMCAIQESNLANLAGGDANSSGAFQQQGYINGIRTQWPASHDVAKDAGGFYDAIAPMYASEPDAPYWKIISDVQHPRKEYETYYQKHFLDAERIVTAYGMPSSDILTANGSAVPGASSSNYEFYRGILPVTGQNNWLPEDSWTCIQRLASEVNWRAFFVSGTFYYVADEDLFASQPRMRITEGQGGVDFIDGDYDENKKVATASVTCRIGRWNAPPGSVVELYDMGVWDGRYLITDVARSLFNDQGTISLEKPHPVLPEPLSDSASKLSSTFQGSSLGSGPLFTSTTPGTAAPNTNINAGGFLPINAKYTPNRVDQGRDGETDPGGPIIAPGDGHVEAILVDPIGFGTNYPVVSFTDGPYAGKTMYIGHTFSRLVPGASFTKGEILSITGTTGGETWNGNATAPGWFEIGFAPFGFPGPLGQDPPF